MPTTVEDPGAPEREEGEEREEELHHVVPECLEGVPGWGGLVGEVSQGVRVRLGLVEVVHAGEISPALVAPHLDQPGPQHDPDYEPPEAQHTDPGGRQSGRELAPAQDGDAPDGEKSCLQQLGLPAEGEPGLADTDQAEVEEPQEEEDEHVGGPRHQDQQGQPGPGQSEAVKQEVEILVVRVGQPQQGGDLSQPVSQVRQLLSNYNSSGQVRSGRVRSSQCSLYH